METFFLSKLKRQTQVSAAATGILARWVGERYLNRPLNAKDHAEAIREILGSFKGPLMKMGQFLAMVPGALPPAYAEAFLSLQSQAPSMGPAFVKRRMAGELGADWRTHFLEFQETAVAAASLGQVHQARLLSGEQVACKLQYPQMDVAVQADLGQLNFLLSLYRTWNRAIDTQHLQQEISDRLHEELDYLQEARHTEAYRSLFEKSPWSSEIQVPRPVSSLTTPRLLTLSWMEGSNLLGFMTHPQEERNRLAALLFHSWYFPFYRYGLIHGDPHPGNYRIGPTGSLLLLDFGCVRRFSGSFIQGVIELYRALQTQDQERAVAAYEAWGFSNLTYELIEIITQWARLLYEPLLEDRVRPLQEDPHGEKGWKVACDVHAKLNQTQGIQPPREFVFMDRAAVGIGSILMRLNAHHNWHRLFEALIEGFDPVDLEIHQASLFSYP